MMQIPERADGRMPHTVQHIGDSRASRKGIVRFQNQSDAVRLRQAKRLRQLIGVGQDCLKRAQRLHQPGVL